MSDKQAEKLREILRGLVGGQPKFQSGDMELCLDCRQHPELNQLLDEYWDAVVTKDLAQIQSQKAGSSTKGMAYLVAETKCNILSSQIDLAVMEIIESTPELMAHFNDNTKCSGFRINRLKRVVDWLPPEAKEESDE